MLMLLYPIENMVVPALHRKSHITNSTSPENKKDQTFISINCLECITIIINYGAALTNFYKDSISNDPNPITLASQITSVLRTG
jgi:hypothetical protein